MKKIALTILAIFCFCSIFAQNSSSTNSGMEVLSSFYDKIYELIREEASFQKLYSLKEQYCTKELLDGVAQMIIDEDLDYDPFIDAQDFAIENMQSLVVEKTEEPDWFVMHYMATDSIIHYVYLKINDDNYICNLRIKISNRLVPIIN